jgi:hypothetical protein
MPMYFLAVFLWNLTLCMIKHTALL